MCYNLIGRRIVIVGKRNIATLREKCGVRTLGVIATELTDGYVYARFAGVSGSVQYIICLCVSKIDRSHADPDIFVARLL